MDFSRTDCSIINCDRTTPFRICGRANCPLATINTDPESKLRGSYYESSSPYVCVTISVNCFVCWHFFRFSDPNLSEGIYKKQHCWDFSADSVLGKEAFGEVPKSANYSDCLTVLKSLISVKVFYPRCWKRLTFLIIAESAGARVLPGMSVSQALAIYFAIVKVGFLWYLVESDLWGALLLE